MDKTLLAISPGNGTFGASLWSGMTLVTANGWRRVNPSKREAVDRRIQEMTEILHCFIGSTVPDKVIIEYLPMAFIDRSLGFNERTNLPEISIVENTLRSPGMSVKGHFKEDIAGYFSCSFPDSRIMFVYPKTWMNGESAAAVQYRVERLIRSGEIKTDGAIGISKRAYERRKALAAVALGWWGVNRARVEEMEAH